MPPDDAGRPAAHPPQRPRGRRGRPAARSVRPGRSGHVAGCAGRERVVVRAAAPRSASPTPAAPGETGYAPVRLHPPRRPHDPRSGHRPAAACPANAVAAVLNVTATNPAAPGWVKVVPDRQRPGRGVEHQRRAAWPDPGEPRHGPAADVGPNGAGRHRLLRPARRRRRRRRRLRAGDDASGRPYVGLDAVGPRARHPRQPRPHQGRRRARSSTSTCRRWSRTAATAVVVNLTVTESNGPGFWTAYVPGSAVPTASNVNTDEADQTRANQAILPIVGNNRSIDVFSYSGGHLVVDVAGYFTGQNPQRPDRRAVRAEHAVPRDRHAPGRALRPDVPEVGVRVRLRRDARRSGRGDQPDHERDPRTRVVRRVRGAHRPAGPGVEPQRHPGRTRPSPTTRSPGHPPPGSPCTRTPAAT